jgi:hypothetical protein
MPRKSDHLTMVPVCDGVNSVVFARSMALGTYLCAPKGDVAATFVEIAILGECAVLEPSS